MPTLSTQPLRTPMMMTCLDFVLTLVIFLTKMPRTSPPPPPLSTPLLPIDTPTNKSPPNFPTQDIQPPTKMTYDEYDRNNGHRSRKTTLRMALKDNVTLTHPPPPGVTTEDWMLNKNDWASAMTHLDFTPTIDRCASQTNSQLPRFAGPEGGEVNDFR
ncbi:hypothetical protein SARC_00221 [Sphaeroforma arctica JP610]|uniref:Uncharacterized protein n=1 Tax=Sphaeroforma arctica JP610 TaxID=667725 RepID=A0A0L0GF36_9EUKA|nr:hypothetical protein SARC_00221 [Sphaeroforma arctica JP610]KNC87650.1 hypothetical protein SARC_00221 [Sphaeroforma arctica JP610]|eukprot:XP_014161552.1 hypothetical protein SARC_00221 [Sphaeroforma arctica JP610]